jgi:hypothetical protein
MAIEFYCPHCGVHYMLKGTFADKEGTCKNPESKKPFIIPCSNHNNKRERIVEDLISIQDVWAVVSHKFDGGTL